ncbi:MAG: SemiSWEET transporter [Nanoarchaeota archaeon]
MDYTLILGLTAGALTTVCYLPQVIKTWRLKETKDLSLGTYVLLSVGIVLWLIYGITTKDIPVIIANLLSLILSLILLFFKLKYG